MECYVEKKRERRIRDFRRMVGRAYRVYKRYWPEPELSYHVISPRTWEGVHLLRWQQARKYANHLKRCSCSHGCGNPRRHWGDRTNQECRESLKAIDQLMDLGFFDESPGQLQVRRKRPWV